MTIKLREKEELILEIKPHPIAFMELYLIAIYLVAINIIIRAYMDEILAQIKGYMGMGFLSLEQISTIVWALVTIIPFIIMFIMKSSIKWLVTGILMVAIPIIVEMKIEIITKTTMGVILGIIWLALSNMYRKAHTYYITNERVISEYKFLREKHREINYQYLSDIIVEKGIIGRILNIGTVIPVSTAGLGLGGEIAAISGKLDVKQATLGVIAGASINIPKGRSPNILFGVKNPMKIKEIISQEIAKHSESGLLTKISENLEKVLEKTKEN